MPRITPRFDNTVEVSYPMREAQQVITKAEYDLIVRLSRDGKVPLIKFIRDQYGLGLFEAKHIVDTIAESCPI